MHNSDLGVVHFVSPAGGLLNAQGAQGRPLHISPATFLCIFPGYRFFETAPDRTAGTTGPTDNATPVVAACGHAALQCSTGVRRKSQACSGGC